MGTATTHLAFALARMGHAVDVLIGWRHSADDIEPEWADAYRSAGIRIRAAASSEEPVEPAHFAVARKVELELRAEPPNVVVVHDLGGPAYSALRLRQAGTAFQDTLFIVYCHGARRYILELSQTLGVKDLRELLEVAVHEQASVELADVVVSPSAYLVDWMRNDGWSLPDQTVVIPYFTRSSALGGIVRRLDRHGRARRLVFFGRLDERKGITLLTSALNALPTELLAGVKLDFVGKPTATWSPERIASLLSQQTRRALEGIGFETALDQRQALEHLQAPGTLVVMPSLRENSPNTVYECLEHGIPFVASDVGGVSELIAPEDRPRVLFEPTPEGVERALRAVLGSGDTLQPVRASFDADEAYERWAEVIKLQPQRQQTREHADDEFVLLVGDDDVPDGQLLDILRRAQEATGADVVTCGVRVTNDQGSTLHLFSGEPGGLGALSNGYGTVGLVPRSLLPAAEADLGWPLFAALASKGAQIVSVPLPLVTQQRPPGSVEGTPADALLAVQALETGLPRPLRALARVAAGLALTQTQAPTRSRGLIRRALGRIRRLGSAA
jgi:glycosyltransferase involved in cell wall biosynthesis